MDQSAFISTANSASNLTNDVTMAVFVIFGVGLFFLYMLPFIIAQRRQSENTGIVFVINFFFGLTIIGWIGAMALALLSNKRQMIIVQAPASVP